MNKAKLVLQYFGQYKPTKLRLIPTWRWGLYRIQIDDHIVDFRFLDGAHPEDGGCRKRDKKRRN
jgi:hypothetical protein